MVYKVMKRYMELRRRVLLEIEGALEGGSEQIMEGIASPRSASNLPHKRRSPS